MLATLIHLIDGLRNGFGVALERNYFLAQLGLCGIQGASFIYAANEMDTALIAVIVYWPILALTSIGLFIAFMVKSRGQE